MKYHKIRNVELSTCTAEQKIAYNLAFSLHISGYSDEYEKMPMEFQKCEVAETAVREGMRRYKNSKDYNPGKYDEDAIFCALNCGIKDYFKSSKKVLGSYQEVGEMFPANYLNLKK